MNDPMRDDLFDREISDFLAYHANDVADAPNATSMAARLTAGTAGARRAGLGVTPELAWIVLVGLLGLALIGAMVAGARLLREDPVAVAEATATPPGTSSYEAVFLRRDPSMDIVVVGVDSEGRERVITRLVDAWWNHNTQAPAGALAPSGLLAMATGINPRTVRWTIFDVLRPEATPIVISGIAPQDVEQLSYAFPIGLTSGGFRPAARAWWGPGDRLAIHWYERIPLEGTSFTRNYFMTFADGATGEATSFVVDPELEFRPYWTPDGSGIFVRTSSQGQILRADGNLAPAVDAVPEASCHRPPNSYLDRESDETTACISPDASLVARDAGSLEDPAGTVTVQANGESFEIVGRFAGWLNVDP